MAGSGSFFRSGVISLALGCGTAAPAPAPPATAAAYADAVAARNCAAMDACGCPFLASTDGGLPADACAFALASAWRIPFEDPRVVYEPERAALELRTWDAATTTCTFPDGLPPFRGLVAAGGACDEHYQCVAGHHCGTGSVCVVGAAPASTPVGICPVGP